jgi:hypothetical protein
MVVIRNTSELFFSLWYIFLKVKVKLSLCFNRAPRSEGVLGGWKCSSTHSLTLALDGVSGQLHAPAALSPGKELLAPVG